MKVLVADDNRTICVMLKKLLSSWGYQVVLTANGDEALEVLSGSDLPQIAILDWVMPGKTGVEICAECERLNLLVYRILLTAKEEDEDMMYALDHGAHDFQRKPIVPGILRSRIAVGKRLVEATQEAMRSERLAAVGSLVAGVAHHFNNLNMPILMYASSILKSADLDPDIQKKAQKIRKAARQAGALAQRLMSVASNKKQKKELADLNGLVTEAIEIESISFDQRGITVETDLKTIPNVPMVIADASHVVTNFLGNARDALIARPEKKIIVKTGMENGRIYMSVTDTGCGIATNKLQKIFSPFYTEKGEFAETHSPLKEVKGVGVGLYASRQMATDHGGEITVESEVDKGSTFTLWLPAAQASQ